MCEAGRVRIAVLGPLAMWAADGTPLDVRGVRLRGLLARLALSAGRPVGVETLGPVRPGRVHADHRPRLRRRSPVRGSGTTRSRAAGLRPGAGTDPAQPGGEAVA